MNLCEEVSDTIGYAKINQIMYSTCQSYSREHISNESHWTHSVLVAKQHIPGSKVPVHNLVSSEVGHPFGHLHAVAVHLLQVDECAVLLQEVQEGTKRGYLLDL